MRAHVLLCMLAYYVEFHLRDWLAPVLFQDDDAAAGEALRENVVKPARRSPKAIDKAVTRRTDDDLPVHSFPSLMRDLATITRNTIQPKFPGAKPFIKTTLPTPFQRRVFTLLQVPPP